MTLRVVYSTMRHDKCMVLVAMQPSMFGLPPCHDVFLCRPRSWLGPGIAKLMQPRSCFPRAAKDFSGGAAVTFRPWEAFLFWDRHFA